MPTGHLATTGNRKAHLEFDIGHLAGLPTCNHGGPVVERLVEFPEGTGLEESIAILLAAGIAPSRLCGHCFGRRTRVLYRTRWATRKQGT